MTCEEAKGLLSAFIDNELLKTERDNVQKHIDNCPQCKKELEELKEINELLSSLEEVPLPVEFDARLHQALVAESNQMSMAKVMPINKNKFKNWRRISSIAAVFMVGLFSIVLYNNNSDDFNQQDLYNANQVENLMTLDDTEQPVEKVEGTKLAPEPAPIAATAPEVQPIPETTVKSAPKVKKERAVVVEDNVPAPTEVPPVDNAGGTEEVVPEQPVVNSVTVDNTDNTMTPSQLRSNAPLPDEEIRLYLNQLEEILSDVNYTIDGYTENKETNIWDISITITTITTTNADGSELKENAIYCGQDGKLWKKEL